MDKKYTSNLKNNPNSKVSQNTDSTNVVNKSKTRIKALIADTKVKDSTSRGKVAKDAPGSRNASSTRTKRKKSAGKKSEDAVGSECTAVTKSGTSFTVSATRLMKSVTEKLGKDAEKFKSETKNMLTQAKNNFNALRQFSGKSDSAQKSRKARKAPNEDS